MFIMLNIDNDWYTIEYLKCETTGDSWVLYYQYNRALMVLFSGLRSVVVLYMFLCCSLCESRYMSTKFCYSFFRNSLIVPVILPVSIWYFTQFIPWNGTLHVLIQWYSTCFLEWQSTCLVGADILPALFEWHSVCSFGVIFYLPFLNGIKYVLYEWCSTCPIWVVYEQHLLALFKR